jgi:hypothetical protein
MVLARQRTQIKTVDFDAFVSDVAAAIWNQMVKNPAFAAQLRDFASIFDAVEQALSAYRVKSNARRQS